MLKLFELIQGFREAIQTASVFCGTQQQFVNTPHFCFSRAVKEKLKLKEKLNLKEDKKPAPIQHEHKQSDRADPKTKMNDEAFIANCNLGVQHLPERLMKRAHQVFSKYHTNDIRRMGHDFMMMYQNLHATEKPRDISTSAPFANTEDLIEPDQSNKNQIIYLRNPKVNEEEAAKAAEEKRKNKKLKILKSQDDQKRLENQQTDAKNQEKNENILSNKEEGTDEQSNTSTKIKEEELKIQDQREKNSNQQNMEKQLLVYQQNTAVAYLLRKMPHTFGVACRILSEVKYRLPNFTAETFLDFGAGLGSGAYAFADMFPNFKTIVACEPSIVMRKLGNHLTQDINKLTWIDTLARTVTMPNAQQFDIVYCGFVLQEVPTPQARQLIVDTLWSKVRQGGLLIIADPGTPKGFRFIHDCRRHFLSDKFRNIAQIVAPCTHQKSCPLAQSGVHWCHFEQKIAKYPKAVFPKLPKERQQDLEKFSFIIISKDKLISQEEDIEVKEEGLANKNSNIEKKLEADIIKAENEEADQKPDETAVQKSFRWDRILFPIRKRTKHILFDACTSRGKFERFIIAKSHGKDNGYTELKDLRWGDLWRFPKRIPNKFRKEGPKKRRLW